MLSRSQLNAIPSLFDAAISDNAWTAALDALVSGVGGKSALLFAFEQGFRPYSVAKASEVLRDSQEALDEYSRRFKTYEEEAMAFFARNPPQTLSKETDIWPGLDRLKVRGDFQWTRDRYGIYRRVGTRLNGNAAWFDACIIHFGTELDTIPEENLMLIEQFLPSLAKVVELNRFFHVLQTRYHAALAALDHVQIGICLTDARGYIVVSNDEADRILAAADGLTRGRDERLLCRSEDQVLALRGAIATAAATAVGEKSTPEALLVIERPSNAKPYLIEVTPLRDSLKEIDSSFSGAMVSIIDPENPRPFSIRNVAALYHLSPAEAEVCRLLVEGTTNEHIAEMRDVSIETVRTQVKAIYRKLDVSSRADLLREVLTVNPPIE